MPSGFFQPAKLGASRLPAGPARNRLFVGSRRVSMKLAQRSSFGRYLAMASRVAADQQQLGLHQQARRR